jgi:hypothetical protein
LSAREKDDLIAFLRTLSSTKKATPPPPLPVPTRRGPG